MKNRIGKEFTQNSQTTSSWYVRDAQARQCLDLLFQQDLAMPVPIFYIGSNAMATYKQPPINHPIGLKQYELTNHLGNVLSTISDFKVPVDIGNNGSTDYFTATVISQQSFYPFGMLMPERKFSVTNGNYRFGFNGQEKDDEIKGEGNSYVFEYRIHDARLGRFLSVDPIAANYPWNSPYAFAENRVIDGIDLEGREWSKSVTVDGDGITHITITVNVKAVNNSNMPPDQYSQHLSDVSAQFKTSLEVYDGNSNIQYHGELIFGEGTINYNIDNTFGDGYLAASYGGQISNAVNQRTIANPEIQAKTKDELIVDGMHELLHTGGVRHPWDEDNAAQDTKLDVINDNNGLPTDNLKSTSTTIKPDIYFNAMIYPFKNVDNLNVGDVSGGSKNLNKVSSGQLNVISTNIDKGLVNGEPNR